MTKLSNQKFESLFFKEIDKNFIYENKPKIAVGVSGGPDSISLVFLLNKWIKKRNGKLIALIVNHKIRKNSNLESNQVKNYLIKNDIQSKILNVSKKNVDKASMYEARENRFSKIVNYCKLNKIFYVFLGHHFEDNLETFILRKAAGSNIEGLNVMQYKSVYQGIQVVRPLINFSKNSIIKYIYNKKLNYINDPSNEDEKYSRVVVRNFLKNNNDIKFIKKDFNFIKINYPNYISMIYRVFLLTNYKLQNNNIIFFSEIFLNLDLEIQVKLIQINYKFLNLDKPFLRYKKIVAAISQINKFKRISINLGGIKIRKIERFIYFSL